MNEATNTFIDGMILDLNPLTTPNNCMTSALNATILTFNGNDHVLQNDMGNGRVESAYLPEGYVPVGTALLGGIVYIASYNPITKKSLLGSFPSPERNILSNEINKSNKSLSTNSYFEDIESKFINIPFQKLILFDKELNPGDKFKVFCTNLNDNKSIISSWVEGNTNINLYPKYLKFNIVSVTKNGTIDKLEDDLVYYDKFYIDEANLDENDSNTLNIDNPTEYRNLIESQYSVFKPKSNSSGRLGIVLELEAIDGFECSWTAKYNNDKSIWEFYLNLNWTYNNKSKHRDQINPNRIYIPELKDNDGFLSLTGYPYQIIEGNKARTDTSKSAQELDVVDRNMLIPNAFFRYLDPVNKNIIRKNDGSDNDFLLPTPITFEESSGEIKFTVYPAMPYGILKYLGKDFKIDISKLGTGYLDLKEFRYYVSDTKVIINWGLDAYPRENTQIEEVKFNFYKIDKQVLNNFYKGLDLILPFALESAEQGQENNVPNIDDHRLRGKYWEELKDNGDWIKASGDPLKLPENPTREYKISKKQSYSGHFVESIDFDDALSKDVAYLCEIVIRYEGVDYKYYRMFYADGIFNDYYNSQLDFKDISLDEAIDIDFDIQTSDTSNYQYTNVLIKDDKEEVTKQTLEQTLVPYTDNPESVTHNLQTTVNNKFGVTFEPKCNNSSIFKASIQTINKSESSDIENIYNEKINISPYTIISDSVGLIDTDKIDKPIVTEPITTINKTSSPNQLYITNDFKVNHSAFIDYKSIREIPVNYELIPLDMDASFFLMHDLEGKGGAIFLYDTFDDIDYRELPESGCDRYNDNAHVTHTLEGYPNVYKKLKDNLKHNDIFILATSIAKRSENDKSPAIKIIKNSNLWGLYVKQKHLTNHKAYLLYAVKDKNENIVFIYIGFPYELNYANKYKSWHNMTNYNEDKYYQPDAKITKFSPIALQIEKDINEKSILIDKIENYIDFDENGVDQDLLNVYTTFSDNIYAPFANYCKPSQSINESVNKYTWTYAIYYNLFNINQSIKFDLDSTLNIFINGLLFERKYTTLPKNLNISSKQTLPFSYSIQNKISMSDIQSILTNTKDKVLVKIGESEDEKGNKHSIIKYYDLFNKGIYLKNNNDVVFTNNIYGIPVELDENLNVVISRKSGGTICDFLFANERQRVHIKDCILAVTESDPSEDNSDNSNGGSSSGGSVGGSGGGNNSGGDIITIEPYDPDKNKNNNGALNLTINGRN